MIRNRALPGMRRDRECLFILFVSLLSVSVMQDCLFLVSYGKIVADISRKEKLNVLVRDFE